MLIHLENGCRFDMEDLDRYARNCFQWRYYVVDEYANYLLNSDRYRPQAQGEYDYTLDAWRCDECDREFDHEALLDKHLASPIHHPLVYKCPECDARFSVLSALVQHVESNACAEGIYEGTGSIGKMLRYLWRCI